MRIGTLVKHIEYEYIGGLIQPGHDTDGWLVYYENGVVRDRRCSECELEVLCV